jgi:hypothetical protein
MRARRPSGVLPLTISAENPASTSWATVSADWATVAQNTSDRRPFMCSTIAATV